MIIFIGGQLGLGLFPPKKQAGIAVPVASVIGTDRLILVGYLAQGVLEYVGLLGWGRRNVNLVTKWDTFD